MIGDLGKKLIIDSEINTRPNPHMLIDRSEKRRLPKEQKGEFDASFFYTLGVYFIEYRPVVSKSKRKSKFLITCDLFVGSRARVTDYEEFKELSKEIDNFKILIRYTNISKKIFEIAENNPYIKIPLTLKIEEMYDILKAKSDGKEPVFTMNDTGEQEALRRKEQNKVRKAKGDMLGKWLL